MVGDKDLVPLDERQRRQVADNLALVTVHLRRHLLAGGRPTRDREWEDLFQEGCIGLIRAVRSFRAEAGIDFAIYALPRIHTAVSRALRGGFATLRRPLYPRTRRGDKPDTTPAAVGPLEFDPPDRRAQVRSDPGDGATGETVGERLRDRYAETVDRVVRRMGGARCAPKDRAAVMDRIVQERLLVPEEHARTPLRSIARHTNSSYARIAKCEKRILDLVRAELADDGETEHLRETARRSPAGMATPVDADLIDDLERLRVDRFVARLISIAPRTRGAMLLTLIDAAGTSVEATARSLLEAMPPERRTRLVDDAA